MKLPACCSTLTAKCLLLGCCAALFISEAVYADNGIVSPAPQRVAELRHLLREDCGACHGLTLNGGLGSPLTAAALAGKPGDSLVATLLDGRPGSAMPPWRPFMSEAEAQWLVRQLQQGVTP